MKNKPPERPLEFGFASEAFNLVIEQTEDGARVQRELDEQREAKRMNEDRQTTID